MIHIVLVEPEIPQNTGNIVRTGAATGSVVHLVRPLGFDTSDKMLKRAGLDYWKDCEIHYWDSFDELRSVYADKDFYFFSTKAKQSHSDPEYNEDVFLVFGKETKGLPEKLIHDNYSNAVRIPMIADTRSLNLSNSVAVAVYEVLRQRNYKGMNLTGRLREYDD
ncbi:MAG: tRNA (uridine(34)/cytosine(34)/5-carboxymethylaminomethyluridine(34)-2'-O)-methyltransferase TrmL [Firmicutes bacterium]|nr:tRNA (uridine(34)/cytosine(34)/5-carboxymethylaminomethyluridine(34)-2'-O)-methyltransferase TrmL [Bacillota bacterium]